MCAGIVNGLNTVVFPGGGSAAGSDDVLLIGLRVIQAGSRLYEYETALHGCGWDPVLSEQKGGMPVFLLPP
jgi:hypothetical protein